MRLFYTILSLVVALNCYSQRVLYSEPDREDSRAMNFDIIGKSKGNFLIYKGGFTEHFINVYDNEMQLLKKNKLDLQNDNEKIISINFIWFNDYAWVLYQYQKRRLIFYKALKINDDGVSEGKAITLDSTDSRDVSDNKVYNLLYSANKKFIAFIKLNNFNEKKHTVNFSLYNENLNLINSTSHEVEMKEKNSFLSGFELNNLGDLVFCKAIGTNSNDNLNQLILITKKLNDDNFIYTDLKKHDNCFFDEIKVKIDNFSNNYIITAFYATRKRGDIVGLYTSIFNTTTFKETLSAITLFDDDFKKDAKGDENLKQAFNNYFIKHIIPKKTGGFLLCSEYEKVNSRNDINNWNRWDAFNSPILFNSPGFYNLGGQYDMRWQGLNSFSNITRYFSDNIAIASIDSTGKIEWNNIIIKSQFNDNSDITLGFGLYNAGNQLKILFNELNRQDLILNEQSVNPSGKINRSSTLKNLNLNFEFMPRFAKQVSAKQIIVPCTYRSLLCFAKIDY